MEETENSNKADRPWLFKKGQSGNPGGRPKGKTLKEYAREMLAAMTEEERQTYLHGIDKKVIWEMAESKASQGIGQADDLAKLDLGVVVLPQKNESSLESTTKTSDSPSV